MTNFSSYTVFNDHTSDANFRIWGKAISDNMTAVGLTQTSDTGQINWATVVRAGTNSNAGYEIRAFSDTLQSTRPVYIRIDFGTGSSTSSPRLQWSVGTGTNGAGTLTGVILATVTDTMFATGAGSTTNYTSLMYCDGSSFAWFHNIDYTGAPTSTTPGWFMIERSRDSSGTATSEGVWWFYKAYSTSIGNFAVYPWSGQSWTATGSHPCFMHPKPINSSSSSLNDGTNTYLASFATVGTDTRWYSKMLISYAWADFAQATTFTATHLGTSRTFKAVGLGSFSCRGTSADAYACAAILWDNS